MNKQELKESLQRANVNFEYVHDKLSHILTDLEDEKITPKEFYAEIVELHNWHSHHIN